MNKMENALRELAEMDLLAARRSFVHGLHPGAKLVTTVMYIMTVMSFHKYDLAGLLPMILWPLLLFQLQHCFLFMILFDKISFLVYI